jgi:hypothetical protein
MAVAFQQSAFQESAFQEGQVTVVVTGVDAVGSIGTVTILLSSIIIVTGVDATGYIGTVVVTAAGTAPVTGVVAYGEIGSVLVWGLVPNTQAPNWTLIIN